MSHYSKRPIGDPCLTLIGTLVTSLLLVLSYPPHGVHWLIWVGFVPFVLAIRGARKQDAKVVCGAAFLAGILFHVGAASFLRYASLSGDGRTIQVIGWFGLALVGGISWAIVFVFAARLMWRGIPTAFILPAAVITAEIIRSLLVISIVQVDFPLLRLGAVVVAYPRLAQIADISGVSTLTVLVAIVNGCIADVVFHIAARRTTATGVCGLRTALMCLGFAMLGSLSYGTWRLSQDVFLEGPSVCLVPRLLEYSSTGLPTLRSALEQVEVDSDPSTVSRIDLVVFPELAFKATVVEVAASISLDQRDERKDRIWELARTSDRRNPEAPIYALQHAASMYGVGIVAGCYHALLDDDWDWMYNSAVVVDSSGEVLGCHDKMCLAPGLDFNPYIPWLFGVRLGTEPFRTVPRLSRPSLKHPEGVDSGREYRSFSARSGHSAEHSFAILICYDACSGAVARQLANTVDDKEHPCDFLVQISDESPLGSFQRSSAGFELFFNESRLRAIECRIPIVRNVLYGQSAVIDGNGGVVLSQSDPDCLGTAPFTSLVPLDPRQSVFMLCGDWLSVLLCGAFVLLIGLARKPCKVQFFHALRTFV